MKDHFGRNINYLRLSITDRCNLRCKYCMPHGVEFTPHEQILTYEEFLRVARAAVHLGIPRFKITGGEPLVRKGVTDFIAALKRLPGVEEVTLTTNGVRLAELVPALKAAGVDGVNISLDAADPETFQAITGFDQLGNVLAGLDASLAAGLHTKINFVLLAGCEGRVLPVAKLAQSRPVDVRFIEVMPIGSLTGSTLLAGRGPRITVRMESVGSSEANFRNAFTSAGINQTRHQIQMVLTVQVVLLLPGGTYDRTFTNKITVAESILMGDVPSHYSYFSQFDTAREAADAQRDYSAE